MTWWFWRQIWRFDFSAVWFVRGLCCTDITSLPAGHLFFDWLSWVMFCKKAKNTLKVTIQNSPCFWSLWLRFWDFLYWEFHKSILSYYQLKLLCSLIFDNFWVYPGLPLMDFAVEAFEVIRLWRVLGSRQGMYTEEKVNMERKYGNVCITRVPEVKLFVHLPDVWSHNTAQSIDFWRKFWHIIAGS